MRLLVTQQAPRSEEEAFDTEPPSPESRRRQRPEPLATLPDDEEFELHDTIPAPPWLDEPVEIPKLRP